MLKITIELCPPFGPRKVLGVMEIGNDATGTKSIGNYRVRMWGAGRRRWDGGSVKGFPRRRLGAWDLLYQALVQVVGTRSANVGGHVHEYVRGVPRCPTGECNVR